MSIFVIMRSERKKRKSRSEKLGTKRKAGFIAPDLKELEKSILKIPKTPMHYKCRVFLLFLLHTGVRVSEALSVRVRDIDFKRDIIRIKLQKSKKIKQREIILSPLLHKELYDYIRDFKLKPSQKLFDFSRRNAHLIAKTHLNLHPHALRHSFAVYFLKHTKDVDGLRRLLGHSSYNVIKEYLRYSIEDLKDEFQKVFSEK